MTRHAAVWPARLPMQITSPATSLWTNLVVSAWRYPDKSAMVFMGRSWTYPELLQACEQMAGHLARLGVSQGDRVLLDMQNCPQLVITHFAILRLDAVVVPVNPMNKAQELQHYITDPDVKVAVTTADLAAELAQASAALPPAQRLAHLVVTQFTDVFDPATLDPLDMPAAWQDWLLPQRPLPALADGQVHAWSDLLGQAHGQSLPAPQAGPQDLAVLPYTSGTTGLPKGCMHSHRTVMFNTVAGGVWSQGNQGAVGLAVRRARVSRS